MKHDFADSRDAQVWAQNFVRIRQEVLDDWGVDIGSDEGTMIAWFANCMAAEQSYWSMKEMLRNAGVETFEEYLAQL